MSHAPTLEEILREAVCYDEEEEGWLCEIPWEEDLWARGKTREEALEGLAACIREWLEEEGWGEEAEGDEDIQPLQEPWTPGLFGIPWRWILIPSLLLVSLLVTLVVLAGHPPQAVPATASPMATFRPIQPMPPAPSSPWVPVERPQEDRYREMWREWEQEQRLRKMEQHLHQLETRLDLCSDPDTGSFARAYFCH